MSLSQAEYIWFDGTKPVSQLRSKTRILKLPKGVTLKNFPEWSFDGSSTYQSTGDNSDCILKPVNFIKDPLRSGNNYLVLCEVLDSAGNIHPTNTRANLREVIKNIPKKQDPWIGFEQEYTLYDGDLPLGWPESGEPAPQGPYYCGVGADKSFGRQIAEEHKDACIAAGILFSGINSEVMPGQWEFQVGYRGIKDEDASPLNIADHLLLSRWLLQRIAEDYTINVSFAVKPMAGDWNGAGLHTNFSTTDTRNVKKGMDAINEAINKLSKCHQEHIDGYGHNLENRLTGAHETCDIKTFKADISDRGCSIRIPLAVAKNGCGYFEDRRPGADADPYVVAMLICKNVCL